jgi:hypothetical protein
MSDSPVKEKRKIIEMIGYPYFGKEEKSPTVFFS